jgi:23S rRNA pseudouridine1911/1915/1917 synthase
VRVAGRIAKKGERARAGDRISIELAASDAAEPEPDVPLELRLERADLVVVNKPAGQPTAAVRGSTQGTLAGALVARYPEMARIGSAREPGLVHRLDTQTSGLVVAARTAEAFEALRRQLAAGAIDKRYLAIVESAGLPGEGVIDLPIAPRDARRVVAREGMRGSRPALTEWRTLRRREPWALIEARASPARRHQVRAHLAAIGHPIANDVLYGGRAVQALGARHALHASYVACAGDATLAGFAIEEPLPADLAGLL